MNPSLQKGHATAPVVGAPPVPHAPGRESRRVADEIVDLLFRAGVRTVFGLPGGAIAPVYDALLDRPEIRVVTCKHETMAVFAAAAYARASDGVGIVLVTSGPGVTNAVTGVASAMSDGLPLVLLAGEVPRAQFGHGALQEGSPYSLNLRGMLEPITKATFELTNPDSAGTVLTKAIATARSGRKGPVFVSLPLDITRSPVAIPRVSSHVSTQFDVDGPLLDEVADLLVNAERPVIFAGSGTRWDRGPAQLLRLAERVRVPVITSPKAKGVFPESHELALGVYGFGGHPSAAKYLEGGIDVLFAIGTSFGEVGTNAWNPAIKATKAFIQLDIDAAQIGKNYRADIGLVGPADAVLRQLLERTPQNRRLLEVRGVRRQGDAEAAVGDGPIKPQRAIWELQQIMPPDTIYCVDVGDHSLFAIHYLSIDEPNCFYFSGLASMGSGIGAALGVKVALEGQAVVCICGDGGLSMTGGELLTVAQEKMPIVFAVINNRQYGMVERGDRHIFGRTPGFPLSPLDVSAVARGLGVQSIAVRQPGEILALGDDNLGTAPLLLDVIVDPGEPAPGSERFKALHV